MGGEGLRKIGRSSGLVGERRERRGYGYDNEREAVDDPGAGGSAGSSNGQRLKDEQVLSLASSWLMPFGIKLHEVAY